MIYMHQKIKDKELEARQGIALPSTKKIQQALVISNATRFFQAPDASSAKPMTPFNRMNQMKDFLGSIQAIASGKIVTAEDLMGVTIEQDWKMRHYLNTAKTSIDVGKQRKLFNEIVSGASFISYDMENLGGVDEFGANRFDYLTELAYTEGDMGNQNIETALGRTHQYLFGLSETEYDALVREVSQPGFVYQSGRGKVLFDRLAIYGHDDTIIKGNKVLNEGKLGEGLPSLKQVLRGAKRLREAGINDEATLRDGKTNGQRFIDDFMKKAQTNIVAGHNILGFDNSKMGIMGYNMENVKSLDTLAILRAAAANAPKEEMLGAVNSLRGKTSFTQENLVNLIYGSDSDLAAHTASVDSAFHSMILSSEKFRNIINNYMPRTQTGINMLPGQALLHVNQSSYGDFKGLSFMSLPTGEMRTGSGFTFDENGLTKDLFQTSALRKGGLYTYEGSGKMALTKKMRDSMRFINADYAQEHLYYVNLKSHGIDGTLESGSITTQVFNSRRAMEEFMASNDLIGVRQDTDENFVLPTGALGEHAKKIMTYHNLETKESKQLSLGEFIEEKTRFNSKDRASRKLRGFELKDAERTRELLKAIQGNLGGRKVREVASIGFSHDYKIAATMIDGSVVATQIGMEGLKGIIGHNYDGKQRLYHQTVDNLLTQSSFFLNNQEAMKEVLGFVETHYGNASKRQKEEAYRTLMKGLTDDAVKRSALQTNELNFVEVRRDAIGAFKKSEQLISSDYMRNTIRVNLDGNNKDINLIKSLMNQYYKNKEFTPDDYNLQATRLLGTFADAMSIDIDTNAYGDPVILSDTIINILKERKKEDAHYGIINTLSQEENVIDLLISTDNIEERLYEHSKHIRQIQDINSGALADDLIKTFNTKIDSRYFYNFGFDEKHARFMHQMHDRIIEEQRQFFTKVFDEFKHVPGMELILDGKHFYAKHQDTIVDLAKYIPQYKVHGQMAYFQIGRSQVAATGAFFANGVNDIFMGSNLKAAADGVRFSYRGHRESVKQGFGNSASGIATVFSLFGQGLRESGDVSAKNMMNRNSNFMVDYNRIMGLAAIMAEKGDINIADPKEKATLQKFLDDSRQKHNTDVVDMENTDQHYRSIARRHLDEMLFVLVSKKSKQSLEYFAAANLGPYGTESFVNNGFANVGNASHMAHYDLEVGKRLTAHQNNFFSFEKAQAQSNYDTITKYKPKYGDQTINMPGFRFGAGVETKAGTYRTNTILDSFSQLDKHYSNQIVIKKAHTSPELFKFALEKYMLNNQVDDQIAAKLTQLSLMEDESWVDSRIKDAFFVQNEIQKVALDKDYIENDAFVEMYNELNYKLDVDADGNTVFKYGGSKSVKQNDMVFDLVGYRDTVDQRLARYDGTLKIGFYGQQENIFLDEADINQLIKGKSIEEAQAYLDNELNAYFYIERSQQEMYSKLNASNVEKTKSRASVFLPGEYDKNVARRLKQEGASELIGSEMKWEDILKRARQLNVSDELLGLMTIERHRVSDVVQMAFGNQGLAFITGEDTGKHRGGGGYINDVLRTVHGYHLENNISLSQMQDNLREAVGNFEFGEDGTILFANGRSKVNISKLKQALAKHYIDADNNPIFDEKTLGRSLVIDGDLFATVFDSNLAQTKENDIITGHMPTELLPQAKEHSRIIDDLQSQIDELNLNIEHIKQKKALNIDNDNGSDYHKILQEQQAIRHQRIFDNLQKGQAILAEAQGKLNTSKYDSNRQTLSTINARLNEIANDIKQHNLAINVNIEQIIKNRTDYAPIQTLVAKNTEYNGQIKTLQTQRQQLIEQKRAGVADIDAKMQALYWEMQNIEGDIQMTRQDLELTLGQEKRSVIRHKKKSGDYGKLYKDLARQKRELQESLNSEIKNIDLSLKALRAEININKQIIETNEEIAPNANRSLINTNQNSRDEVKRLKKERQELLDRRTQVSAELNAEKVLLRDVNKAQRVVNSREHYKQSQLDTATKQAEKMAQHQTMGIFGDYDKQERLMSGKLTHLNRELRHAKDARFRHLEAYEGRAKGVKRDDRKFAFLRNIKYDANVLKGLPSSLLDQLKLSDGAKVGFDDLNNLDQKPILQNVLAHMMKDAQTNTKYDLLTPGTADSVIDGFTTNQAIRTGMKNIYRNSHYEGKALEELSLELVEAKYVLSQMGAAREFNNNRATIEELTSRGFEVIDIRRYTEAFAEDSDLIKTGNSIFSKDLILDIDGQKVAMPYLPSSTLGNSVVQRGYEYNITRLRDALFERDSFEEGSKEWHSANQALGPLIEQVKKDNLNIPSKDGPLNDRLYARSQQSARAASGSMTDLYMKRGAGDSNWEENISDAARAMFKGKSIKDWALEDDVYLDAVWGSKAFFETLGINDDYLSEQFGDAKKGWDYLSETGLQGFITRDPVIEEGSYKTGRLYFSEHLKGNSIKTGQHTQISLAGDHDGDTNAFDVMRWQVNGRMQNSLELRRDESAEALLSEHDRLYGLNGATTNRHLASKLKAIYADQDMASQLTKYRDAANSNYNKLLANVFGDEIVAEHLTNPYFDMGKERYDAIHSNIEKLGEIIPIDFDDLRNTYDRITESDAMTDEEKQMYLSDFKAYASLSRRQQTADTKTFKNAIGEINLKLYEMRSQGEVAMRTNKITDRDMTLLQEMTYAMEQEVISSKNARGGVDIGATNDLSEIIRGAYSGRSVNYNNKDQTAIEAMREYMDRLFVNEETGKNLFDDKYANRTNKAGDSTYDDAVDAVINLMGLYRDKKYHATRDYFRLFTRGQSTMHYYNKKSAELGAQTYDGLRGMLSTMADAFGEETDRYDMSDVTGPNKTLENLFIDKEIVDEVAAGAAERVIRQNNVLSNITHNGSKINNAAAGLALGGIGAYMLVGALGNSVTANTTNQAEQFQGDTLSDYGSSYNPEQQATQTQSSGYVINVNARTDAATVERVAGQFNQSISQSLNANLNMTLNVNESTMKQYELTQLIQNTLFNH